MVTCVESTPAPSKTVNGELKSRAIMTLMGNGSDEKPTPSYKGVLIANGSAYIDMTNSAAYLYDEENAEWKAQ